MPLLSFALGQLSSSFTPTAPSARFSSGGPDTFGTVSAMRVAVLTVDGMFDSGLTTMLDILATANALSGRAGLAGAPFEVTVAGRGTSVRTGHGLRLATVPWPELRNDPPELAVMPAVGLRPPAEIVDYVRGHDFLSAIGTLSASGVGLAAACSGTFFLGEAGGLDGLTATTSWWLSPAFRTRYPRVDLDDSRALAVAGKVTTAGAAFAHIDLALSLVQRSSPALAELVTRYLVIGDRPSQAAAAVPSLLATGDPTIAAFERYIREHLAGPVQIEDAAPSSGPPRPPSACHRSTSCRRSGWSRPPSCSGPPPRPRPPSPPPSAIRTSVPCAR